MKYVWISCDKQDYTALPDKSFNIIKRLMQLLTNNYNHIERLLSTPLSHDGDTLKMGANRMASSDGYWEKICKFVV